MNLRGRSFLTLLDYSPEEIRYLLDLSHALKREKRERVFPERLKHKNIVLIFDKTSTRTRCAPGPLPKRRATRVPTSPQPTISRRGRRKRAGKAPSGLMPAPLGSAAPSADCLAQARCGLVGLKAGVQRVKAKLALFCSD